MKQILLKILKGIIYVIILAAAVGFIYHFIRGIYCSLFADDVITAQNRVASAYQFLYMAGAGIINGFEDGTFRPEKFVTRAEAMKVINRTLGRNPHKEQLLPGMITWADNTGDKW